jgi:hypothetical protein
MAICGDINIVKTYWKSGIRGLLGDLYGPNPPAQIVSTAHDLWPKLYKHYLCIDIYHYIVASVRHLGTPRNVL